MCKELNIIEASNMKYNEKEFYVKYTNGVIDDLTVTNVNGDLIWNDISKSTSKGMKEFINAKFIPVEKPLDFMTLVKNCELNNIRVEINDENIYIPEESAYFTQYIFNLANKNTNDNFRELILNGKWYIED